MEELTNAINLLGDEAGIKKVFLFNHSAEFICEDSGNSFTDHGRNYCIEQVKSLTSLAQEYRVQNEELTYDLDEAKVSILFLDYAILMVFMESNIDYSSIHIALNSLGRQINTFMARSQSANTQNQGITKPKIRFASRSSSIDKSSLPDVIDADSSFIIYLKKLITHYAGAGAARELNNYLHEKRIHVEELDSLGAYNLIEGLCNYLEIKNGDDFKIDAQQVLNRYF